MFEGLKRACLKPSSVYECMSNFTKKFGVQKPFGKRSPGAFLFTFLVLCEGYFGEALKHVCMYVWIAQACMYACMFEFLDRVCMFEFLDRVCMYVWRPQACMFERVCLSVYVCMPQTYIHKPNIHTQLVDLPYRKAFQEALERVCMFKNPLPVMKKRSNIHEKHA